jgi:hypothetical protein
MPTWLGLLIVILAVASRPIEVRLWRAGRLSDRTVTLLILGRFPLLTAVSVVTLGGSLPLGLVLIGAALLPGVLFYRHLLRMVRERSPRSY